MMKKVRHQIRQTLVGRRGVPRSCELVNRVFWRVPQNSSFLEDKLWSDNPNRSDLLIWWDGLLQDRHMSDFHSFMRDLIWLRRRHPALRSEPINVFHIDEYNRVLAFHRWAPGAGRDVVVIACLREQTFYDRGYNLGFPLPGHWNEVFNSDFYDFCPNPWVQGNGGGVDADGPPLHNLFHSAGIGTPANHMTEDARWDYRVTIRFRNSTVATTANPDEESLIKQLWPDQERYKGTTAVRAFVSALGLASHRHHSIKQMTSQVARGLRLKP